VTLTEAFSCFTVMATVTVGTTVMIAGVPSQPGVMPGPAARRAPRPRPGPGSWYWRHGDCDPGPGPWPESLTREACLVLAEAGTDFPSQLMPAGRASAQSSSPKSRRQLCNIPGRNSGPAGLDSAQARARASVTAGPQCPQKSDRSESVFF
jgi:hypothetical protein